MQMMDLYHSLLIHFFHRYIAFLSKDIQEFHFGDWISYHRQANSLALTLLSGLSSLRSLFSYLIIHPVSWQLLPSLRQGSFHWLISQSVRVRLMNGALSNQSK